MVTARVSSGENFIQLLGALAIFAAMLFAIWLVLRWMGNFQRQQMDNRNLQMVECIRVGGNKLIGVVRAGDAWFVVAIGKDEIHPLGELSKEQASAFIQTKGGGGAGSEESFGRMLERVRDSLPKKQDKE